MTFKVPTIVGLPKHLILRVISQSDTDGDGIRAGGWCQGLKSLATAGPGVVG